jgi:hypothetical protein
MEPISRQAPTLKDPLLTTKQLAVVLQRKQGPLELDRMKGIGVPFVRIGRQIRYRQSDVDTYVAGLVAHHSTSEADA